MTRQLLFISLALIVSACQEDMNTSSMSGAGENSAGENSAGENSAGENSAGENSAGENSAGENSAGENSAGEMNTNHWRTSDIYEGLYPSCSTCHSAGQSFPAFATRSQFEQLIVSDPAWITPGHALTSHFIELLEGTYEGAYTQMPPGSESYAEGIAGFDPAPTMAEIKDWINHLEPDDLNNEEVTCVDMPRRGVLTRLSRDEYRHTVKDILSSQLDIGIDFPQENESYGFSHIAALLTLSPLLIEKYDLSAFALAEEALPEHSSPLETYIFEAETDLSSTVGRASGEVWNLWSNGLLSTSFTPPNAGIYQLTLSVAGGQAGPDPVRLALVIDGQDVETFESNAQNPQRDEFITNVTLSATAHQIGVRFLNDYYCPQDRFDAGSCSGLGDRNLLVDRIVIQGPEEVYTPPTPFETRFLTCDPTSISYETCARSILTRFGRLAWRRPLTESELDRLWVLANTEISADDPTLNQWRTGLRQAVHALLLSPYFIFRVEVAPEGQQLSAYERATRLAAFIWRSSPDEILLDAAAEGILDTLEGQTAQVERMLNDHRAQALIKDFGGRWMQLHHLESVAPDYAIFPQFDEELREAMTQEMQRTLETVQQEERSLLDLVNLNFTWVNARLARFYGLGDLYDRAEGDEFRRIALPQAGRLGLLTQGAWLTVTSHPTRTSPVVRGKWVLENLLCSPPPPPPPNVEGLLESGVDQDASVRERLEQHRADPSCAACHTHMDTIGFGFEQFNGIGEFRIMDGRDVIDPSGELPSNPPIAFEDTVELVNALREDEALPRCVAERMIIYALGRGIMEEESCFVDQVMDHAGNYSLQSLAKAITGSVLMSHQGESQ